MNQKKLKLNSAEKINDYAVTLSNELGTLSASYFTALSILLVKFINIQHQTYPHLLIQVLVGYILV